MTQQLTVYESLKRSGVSRRGFLKLCTYTSSILALPAGSGRFVAEALAATPRPSVIWLSFQECTGCTESLTRSYEPTLESLILGQVSLDYHHTLQAASGEAAEAARESAMADNYGSYVLVVDGSLPTGDKEAWSTIAGISNLAMLEEAAAGADVILAIGNCAAFSGLAGADPNPTLARGVADVLSGPDLDKVINVPGCPPIPEVISGVVATYLAMKAGIVSEIPLDDLRRPRGFYASSVHDTCPRLPHYESGEFALTFDDEGARNGHCLYLLGCAGPQTRNACTTMKWTQGTSFPMFSGHGCIGCSEPNFWDRPGGLYGIV